MLVDDLRSFDFEYSRRRRVARVRHSDRKVRHRGSRIRWSELDFEPKIVERQKQVGRKMRQT